MELFPNLNKVLVDTYAIQLFNNIDDWKLFKGTVRDLMVSMRSFSSTDNDFYEHERKVSFIYFDILISFILILDRERKVFEKGARQGGAFDFMEQKFLPKLLSTFRCKTWQQVTSELKNSLASPFLLLLFYFFFNFLSKLCIKGRIRTF